jgi:hypothetical protein
VIAPLGSHLRSHLDIEHPESPVTTDWQLAHRRDKRPELGAFDSISVSLGYFRIPWFRPLNPVDPRRMPPMLYSCGLYLLPRGGSPIWYQMETTIADTAMSWQKFEATFKDSYIALTRLHGSRPLLAWREKA